MAVRRLQSICCQTIKSVTDVCVSSVTVMYKANVYIILIILLGSQLFKRLFLFVLVDELQLEVNGCV